MTENVCVALRDGVPSSLTITLSVLVPSWRASGTQEKAPVAVSKVALVGASGPKLKASASGGLSGSVAVLVKESVEPTPRVWSAIAAKEGGLLMGPGTTVMRFAPVTGWPSGLVITIERLPA